MRLRKSHFQQKSAGSLPKWSLGKLSTQQGSESRIQTDRCLAPSSMALKKIVLLRKVQELEQQKNKMDSKFDSLVAYYERELHIKDERNRKLAAEIQELRSALKDIRKDISIIQQSCSSSKCYKPLGSWKSPYKVMGCKKTPVKSRKAQILDSSSAYFSQRKLRPAAVRKYRG